MCGISGIARFGADAHTPADVDAVRRMTGVLAEDGVTLGFTRLSIVDLAGGRQPFVSADGSVVLIVNGEIYNHRELSAGLPLRTASDCEVLLHLYRQRGTAFLDDVRGMFAVALWDRRRGELLLARDCFGIKPLYFHRARGHVTFASELKALFEDPACPRVLDWAAALDHHALSWEPVLDHAPPTAWFRGVEQVPAGSVVRFDLRSGARTELSYWDLPAGTEEDLSDAEFVRRYHCALASSVEDCLMSDVELGLLLSGGIDSASIAALAAPASPHTFTVVNGTTVVNGDAEHAHVVARDLGLPNHQVLFGHDRVPSLAEWRNLLWVQESPVCGAEQFVKYELYRYVREARPELKVMLLGQGSDEFNGGYSADLSPTGDWPGFLGVLADMGRRGRRHEAPRRVPWWQVAPVPVLRAEPADHYQAFVAMKYRDVQQFNCWHEDRSASANGIEARVPFLDRRLVELTAAVPAHRRAELLWDKRILRDGMRGLLPEGVVDRPKVPFVLGPGGEHTRAMLARFLVGNAADLLDEITAGPRATEHLDADGLRVTFEHLAADPESCSVDLVLRLVNLALLDSMAASPPSRPHAVAPPKAHAVADWAAERATLERLTLNRRRLDTDTVLDFAEGAGLLRDEKAPNRYYLAVDGELAYAIDEDDAPEWVAFLRAVDGKRTVEDALLAADVALPEVAPYLDHVVADGVLVIAT